jgi:C-terminal processing protease CtpA/Prc
MHIQGYLRIPGTLILVLTFLQCAAQKKVENLTTFARLYGYIRFFHPSDEASSIDWNQFAIYGAKRVEACNSPDELLDSLRSIFLPMAPSVQLFRASEKKEFDIRAITPKDKAGYHTVSWQHLGVNLVYKGGIFNSADYVYKSIRIGRGDSLAFSEHAEIGKHVNKKIGTDLQAIVPVALYGNANHTFPESSSKVFSKFKNDINDVGNSMVPGSELYSRLGAIIIAWNIFQHFYPYFDFADTNWEKNLKESLVESYSDTTGILFQGILKKLTAKLKDGHIRVFDPNDPATSCPPIYWEWMENSLVITRVVDSSLNVKDGDVVTHVNGVEAKSYFDSLKNYISAATPQFLAYRAQTESLLGIKGTFLDLTVRRGEISFNTRIKRTINIIYYSPGAIDTKYTIRAITNDITYLNLSATPMATIDSSLSLLQKSKVIICDLRGYPKGNHMFLQYLLNSKDTSHDWMQTPKILYPDQENIAGYLKKGSQLDAKEPHLTAKILCLIDGRCVSYAESVLALVKYYKLATLIGQPTGGTNGNINVFKLPGDYLVSFTGMRVSTPGGQWLHGTGISPDIYISRTIQGVIEGRDQFLENAIKIGEELLRNERKLGRE